MMKVHMQTDTSRLRVVEMTHIALFASLITVCAWISLPTPWGIPFTLQTFAVIFALLCLGGKCGTFAISVYLLLGIVGLPVFSYGRGGVGILLSPDGGYLLGFFVVGVLFWLAESMNIPVRLESSLFLSFLLSVCYGFGTIWCWLVYTRTTGEIGVVSILIQGVFPYIVFDLCKIFLARSLANKLSKHFAR